MREQLDTIPVTEAFETVDECPFCYMERDVEQRSLRYAVGPAASYMEPDVRAAVCRCGFCSHHMKAIYDYGNHLGSALILQTHASSLLSELKEKAENPDAPKKKWIFSRKKADGNEKSYGEILSDRVRSCYLCGKIEYNMARRYHTFFVLLKQAEFREKVLSSKGFCLRHFGRLLLEAEHDLPNSQREWFYPALYHLMSENFQRVKEDLDWFITKYDYRFASEPWKNSKDALPRIMQKIQGIYPSDPPYRDK